MRLRAVCNGSDGNLVHVTAVAEIFTLMSRDEARHAGFLNKAMSDFNLALDLGFLTKNRKYTFFRPQYIFYATYLSEKVGHPYSYIHKLQVQCRSWEFSCIINAHLKSRLLLSQAPCSVQQSPLAQQPTQDHHQCRPCACRLNSWALPKLVIECSSSGGQEAGCLIWCVWCAQIGYWRYISIYRHLQRNPDNQLYPLFEYFENWCQDENRHGDFFSAILKSQPQV